jgi:hypothetical protein
VREADASWQASARLRRMRSLLWADVVKVKLHDLERALKANFNPNQPRVPAGNPDGGQWTGVGGPQASQGSGPGTPRQPNQSQLASSTEDPLGDPPNIPKDRPPTSRGRVRVYVEAAKWLGRAMLRETVGKRLGTFISILEETGWLQPTIDAVRTFADPPKSLEELQEAVSTPAPGYDLHHIVEQTSAEQDGFPRSTIDAPDNLVRVPRLKHWLITGWYMTPNEEFGWPRTYLKQKTWEERVRVGLDALIDAGVLEK